MKIVIAIDSFKGSMSTLVAGEAVKEGITNISTPIPLMYVKNS